MQGYTGLNFEPLGMDQGSETSSTHPGLLPADSSKATEIRASPRVLDRMDSAFPAWLSRKNLVGNLGVEPSVLCVPGAADFRLPRSRNFNVDGPSGLEPESQVSETCALSRWAMDRFAFIRVHSRPNSHLGWPEEIESSWTVPQTAAYPLGHGHT